MLAVVVESDDDVADFSVDRVPLDQRIRERQVRRTRLMLALVLKAAHHFVRAIPHDSQQREQVASNPREAPFTGRINEYVIERMLRQSGLMETPRMLAKNGSIVKDPKVPPARLVQRLPHYWCRQ